MHLATSESVDRPIERGEIVYAVAISGANIASSSALRTYFRNMWSRPRTINNRTKGSFRPRDKQT